MSDDLERRYAVTPLPSADEVLGGQTQGGVAAPSGFFTDDDLAPPAAEKPSLAGLAERVRGARAALAEAEAAFDAAVRAEHGL
ncbi:hypothetical protein [Sphingomonas sp.]|jgi:hypothetical protein|uniref:hypothetical protein n=1 Tax=Sphingomonas sp. TaxID=28214 RepID=UPI002D7E68D5|nr:hypothetical protein [Sphingomonas sp.]HEU0045088.1 hypothetical protein [Sphingomonas sp.]